MSSTEQCPISWSDFNFSCSKKFVCSTFLFVILLCEKEFSLLFSLAFDFPWTLPCVSSPVLFVIFVDEVNPFKSKKRKSMCSLLVLGLKYLPNPKHAVVVFPEICVEASTAFKLVLFLSASHDIIMVTKSLLVCVMYLNTPTLGSEVHLPFCPLPCGLHLRTPDGSYCLKINQ